VSVLRASADRLAPIRASIDRVIPRGALVLTVLSLGYFAMGIVRNWVFANTYGASAELDAYNAAFRIPGIALDVLVAAGLTAPFVPTTRATDRIAIVRRRRRCARGRRGSVVIGWKSRSPAGLPVAHWRRLADHRRNGIPSVREQRVRRSGGSA
jgi:hypothetical protein